jgi:hypothetical protein
MKQSWMYKKKGQEGTAQDSLIPKQFPVIDVTGSVIKIAPNVCTEKRMCQKCRRGDRYGIPLRFILHYSKGGIETVCYRCGMNAAEKAGLELPSTEEDIFAALDAPNSRIIRRYLREEK